MAKSLLVLLSLLAVADAFWLWISPDASPAVFEDLPVTEGSLISADEEIFTQKDAVATTSPAVEITTQNDTVATISSTTSEEITPQNDTVANTSTTAVYMTTQNVTAATTSPTNVDGATETVETTPRLSLAQLSRIYNMRVRFGTTTTAPTTSEPGFPLRTVPGTLRSLVAQLPPLLQKALQAVVRSLVLLTMTTPAGPQLQPLLSAVYRGMDLPPAGPFDWGKSSLEEPGWCDVVEQKMDMLFYFLSLYR